MYENIIRMIQKNLRGRKVVLRWKDEETEQLLLETLGIVPSFYVATNKKYIDNKTTFHDTVLRGRSDEFYLIIAPFLKWGRKADERYRKMGYHRIQDIAWFAGTPRRRRPAGNPQRRGPEGAEQKRRAAAARRRRRKQAQKKKSNAAKPKFFTLSWEKDKEASGFDIYETTGGQIKLLVRIYEPETLEVAIPDNGGERSFSVVSFTDEKGNIIHRNTQLVNHKQG